ncbi:MAG: N(4)-(beta-N-acetylglucosaminyl)-L-asparaginase [Ignavibacteria bacterium]|nr:N(4)-(beta-N-acetylglucosaminyl)-L-asparaginase [Ignavibacteria bacterium]
MSTRRQFLKRLTFLSAAFPFIKSINIKKSFSKEKIKKPVVISTWWFGVEANKEAWNILKAGGRALDAVEAGVKIPEADPKVKSVGYGGLPDRDGHVTLDACIMDEFSNCGAVAFLEHIKHPISVARLVMEKTPHIMLVGEGALKFALSNGFKKENLLTPEAEKDWKEWLKNSEYKPWDFQDVHDTIGMLALDSNGNLAGACTTSGLKYKMHGRVGDSPIIGAGLFVDNEVGAATATGVGEEVIRVAGAHTVVEYMRNGYSPEDACKMTIERILKRFKNKDKTDIQVAFIALNKFGEYGTYAITSDFQYALYTEEEGNRLLQSKSFY